MKIVTKQNFSFEKVIHPSNSEHVIIFGPNYILIINCLIQMQHYIACLDVVNFCFFAFSNLLQRKGANPWYIEDLVVFFSCGTKMWYTPTFNSSRDEETFATQGWFSSLKHLRWKLHRKDVIAESSWKSHLCDERNTVCGANCLRDEGQIRHIKYCGAKTCHHAD